MALAGLLTALLGWRVELAGRVRVMHAGDMFARKGMPLIDFNNGGSGVQYGLTIAKAAATIKNVDKVITGHSDVMTWPDFVE